MDQTLVNIIVGILVVILTSAIGITTAIQAGRNLTGSKKSPIKAILWAILAAAHLFTAIAVGLGALGATVVSDFPLNLESVYDPFVRAWGHWAGDLWDWIVRRVK